MPFVRANDSLFDLVNEITPFELLFFSFVIKCRELFTKPI